MDEQVGRETRHQDESPTPKWLSRELQPHAYQAQVAGRVPKYIVNEDRNIPALSFDGERDSYLQLLTSRWCNPDTPTQLIDFMSVQHESLEKAEDVTDLLHDVHTRARAGECEAGTLDLDLRERLGNDERDESDSQHDVHPRVKAGENEDLLDPTLCLGRTCEAGREHGGKISANGTANCTGTAPRSQHQRVHSSLTSKPPRPRRTLNLLRSFAR